MLILLWLSFNAVTACFTCWLQISQISYWIGTNINQPVGVDVDLAMVVFQRCYRLLYMLVADLTDLLLNGNKYQSTNRSWCWSCCSPLPMPLPLALHAGCRSHRSPIGWEQILINQYELILLWSSSIAATACFTCQLQISQISYWTGTKINQPNRVAGNLAVIVFHCCYSLLYMMVAVPRLRKYWFGYIK